jgi:hypothetical protein
MHKRLAVSSVLLFISPTAFSGDWIPIGSDSRGNVWHIDRASMIQEQNTVTAWRRIDFKPPHPRFLNGAPVKRVHLLYATDCREGQNSVKAMKLVDPEDAIIAAYEHGGQAINWPSGPYDSMLKHAMALTCPKTASSAH